MSYAAPRSFLSRPANLLLCTLLIAVPTAADPLSDLRAGLQRYPAKGPFAVAASLRVNGQSEDVTGARSGSTTFDVESGSAGLVLRVSPAVLGAAESEAEAKTRNPESLTPTRNAMVALAVFDIIDALDMAATLLNDLQGATLIGAAPSPRAGKPATLLRIRVKPTLAGTGGRLVNEPKIELRVWIAPDGTPVAAERDSNYSASFLFVKAANVRKERWEIAVAGDRLYASRAEQSNRASAVGKKMASSLAVTYVPK
ncbi:MAG TPA: hypothetical protein VLV78_08525 [Thermoanaerobaculia bacterium]|nr:hypothetical protein [Thermoanaerobaculia bacterium]